MNNQISFIGAGNMASSLINGLLNDGFAPSSICAADPAATALKALAEKGVATTTDNAQATATAEIIVLAVKPQILGSVAQQLPVKPSQLVVSIAAGVPLASLQAWMTTSQPIVRCMPNTPALLGAGITGLFASDNVSEEQRDQAERLLSAVGKTLWVPAESQHDAVTAVSGSGPAYFFYVMEAMIKAGEALGLDPTTAATLTVETAYGAARMARESNQTPAELRGNVTSPGGTTERALSILDTADCQGIINAALTGAAERSAELAKEFGVDDPA